MPCVTLLSLSQAHLDARIYGAAACCLGHAMHSIVFLTMRMLVFDAYSPRLRTGRLLRSFRQLPTTWPRSTSSRITPILSLLRLNI